MFQGHNAKCSVSSLGPNGFPSTIPINRARVLFITTAAPGTRLRAFNTASSATAWKYHIVIEIEGTIVDLDMNPSERLMEPGLYFRNMFEPKNKSFKNMWRSLGLMPQEEPLEAYVIKSIEAEKFLSEYDKIIDGYKHTSGYYFNLFSRMKGVPAADYFRLRGFSEIETKVPEIDPQLPGKITYTPNEFADDLLDLEWKYKNTKCILRLSDGEIFLFRGKEKKWSGDKTRSWYEDKPVNDAEVVNLFIQKIYFESKTNPKLRKILDDGIEYRRSFD